MAELRLVERLLLLNDRGEGLLLRLHRLKKELYDAASGVGLVTNDKAFLAVAKSTQSTTSSAGLALFEPSGKLHDDLQRMRQQVVKHLTKPYETLVDVTAFVESSLDLLSDCNNLLLDTSRAPDLSKLYLDLIVNFNCMLVMLARTPDLKAICLTVKAVNAVSDKSEWKAACDLICKLSSRPLLAAYKWLKPFQKCLRNSLLSSIYVLYLKQKASSEQWKAEDFLALSNMLQSTDHDRTACPDEMAIRSCMGCPVGLETIELERLEKWFFFSLMHCHFVIDVGQKNSGNYRLWSLMLQGMWVLPIVRDEVLWVHDELIDFFKALKGVKGEHGMSKKIQEVKVMRSMAFSSCTAYHFLRRLHLTSLLQHHHTLFLDDPGLISPCYVHVVKLMSLCKYEICWLVRHQNNVPSSKKHDQAMNQASLRALQIDADCLILLHHLQEMRKLFISQVETNLTGYFASQVAGFDIPALKETLHSEIAKINDPNIETHPLQITLNSVDMIFDKVISGDEIRTGELRRNLLQSLKLDCIRLQSFLVDAPDGSNGDDPATPASWKSLTSRPKRAPSTQLTKDLDSLLSHVDVLLSVCEESDDHDHPLVRNARSNVSFFHASDLSSLTVGYPKSFRAYFYFSMKVEPIAALSCVEINNHFTLECHRLCPEAFEAEARLCTDHAHLFLRVVISQMIYWFRRWFDFHWDVSEGLLPSNELVAFKTGLKIATKRAKGGGISSTEVEQLMLKQPQNKAPKPSPSFRIDDMYSKMTRLCQVVGKTNAITVGAYTFRPRGLFFRALDSEVTSFLTPLLQIGNVATTRNFPATIVAKVDDFAWCCLSTFNLVASSEIDSPSHLFSILSRLGHPEECPMAAKYLQEFYSQVLVPIIDGKLLVFSETMGNFVAPHCLQAAVGGIDDPSRDDLSPLVLGLQRFTSKKELKALAKLFGPLGVHYLVEDLIIHEEVLKDLKALKACTVSNLPTLNVSRILKLCIRLGCSITISDLILAALDEEREARIPFLQVNAKDSRGSTDILRNALHIEGTSFDKEEVSQLVSAITSVIPHAAAFVSSTFVPDAVIKSTVSKNKTNICIDGHFNNLNCFARSIGKLLTALSSEDDEGKIMKMFLAQLSSKMLTFIENTVGKRVHGGETRRSQHHPSLDSVTLLLSLIVEHCPALTTDDLNLHFPLPVLLLHRARCHVVGRAGSGKSKSGKYFKFLTMDMKSLPDEDNSKMEISRSSLSSKVRGSVN